MIFNITTYLHGGAESATSKQKIQYLETSHHNKLTRHETALLLILAHQSYKAILYTYTYCRDSLFPTDRLRQI